MKMKRKHQNLTIIYIPDVSNPIRRTHFRRPIFYLIISFVVITATFLFIWQLNMYIGSNLKITKLSEQLVWEKEQYHQVITDKNGTIDDLQTEILDLSAQTEMINEQLNELKALEAEIRSLSHEEALSLSLESVDHNANQDENMTSLGLGGGTHSVTEEQIQDLVADTKQSLLSLEHELQFLSHRFIQSKTEIAERLRIASLIPSIWPAPSERISSGFGIRKDPFTQRAQFHSGIDITGHLNDSIFAAADGFIADMGRDAVRGNYVYIDHTNGIHTLYMHLHKIAVKKGDTVKKGEEIGFMGSTGRSTGNHLHYEIHENGKQVNPMLFIPK